PLRHWDFEFFYRSVRALRLPCLAAGRSSVSSSYRTCRRLGWISDHLRAPRLRRMIYLANCRALMSGSLISVEGSSTESTLAGGQCTMRESRQAAVLSISRRSPAVAGTRSLGGGPLGLRLGAEG